MPRVGFSYIGAYNKEKGVTPFDRYSMGGSGLSGVNQLGGREIIALRGYEDQYVSHHQAIHIKKIKVDE